MTTAPCGGSIPHAPSTYCYSASASTEMGAHCHTMPDGQFSSMHFHPGGNVLHSHVVMQVTNIGPAIWDFDYNACPELCTGVTKVAIVGDAVAADETYFETPSAEKPKADVIWELLKGACAK